MTVRSRDIHGRDGTRLRVWERVPSSAAEAVLFVHGATYGARAVFDPEGLEAYSWLVATAEAGRGAFGIDIRGYGGSAAPAEFDEPAMANDPIVRASTAARDVRAALDVVYDRFDRVHLVGTSWGTMVCGALVAEGADVSSLTQHAPVYKPPPELHDRFAIDDVGAYRTVQRAEARARWDDQIPAADPAAWRDGSTGESVFAAFWRSVQTGQGIEDGDAIVAPAGALVDIDRVAAGQVPYDAPAITVPTLVIRGSIDPTATRADALALYDDLTVAREYAEIGGGTHFVHLEPRCSALYHAVNAFHDRTP